MVQDSIPGVPVCERENERARENERENLGGCLKLDTNFTSMFCCLLLRDSIRG